MALNNLKQPSLIVSFEALANPSAKVLVLGSMPGQASLHEAQYYAHPRNAFWWIMSELFTFDVKSAYQKKVEYITGRGVAVWDVLAQCARQGSLDSNIEPVSEVANSIAEFLSTYCSIGTIFFNGQKAAQSFNKHVIADLADIESYQFHTLPSTSPANASLSKQQKLQKWQLLLQALGNG